MSPRGTVLRLGGHAPRIHESAFIAPGALVAGDVTIGEGSSVWPGCVLRGDYGSIVVGARTNIQDGSIIHATPTLSTVLGDDVVIGHGARLEGCVVEDGALIGMGAILLHEVRVGSGALVAAGAVVSPRTQVPAGAMALGVPARVKEAADEGVRRERLEANLLNAAQYAENARRWMAEAQEASPAEEVAAG
jgi:carbonic anhydrase/acetyltransferase-like protein (isoleucine patch superfamily)